MKKILFSIFILALSTMIGCQKSEVAEDNLSKQVTVTANIAGSSTTRVALTPATDTNDHPIVKVAWKESGESIKVYDYNTGASEIFTQTSSNKFTGTFPESEYGGYAASYPASADVTLAYGGNQTTYGGTLFTSQNGQLCEDRTVMYGSYNDESQSFEFHHRTTLLSPTFKVGEEIIPTEDIKNIRLKDMLINYTTADFNIDCTSLQARDKIYIYLPHNHDKMYGKHPHPEFEDNYKSTIEMIVETDDEHTYTGAIHFHEGEDYMLFELEQGKLYTATVSLTRVVSPNVITYTTFDNQPITFGQHDLSADLYSSHTFDNGIGRITLNDNVTSLPSYAITSKNVKTITLPSNITTLENVALGINEYLTSIDITYITELRDNALSSNPSLSNITMPQNSYTIGVACFADCTALTQIDLSNATSIGNSAFVSCGSLTTIIIDKDTPPTLGTYTPFDGCPSLSNIYVPDGAVETYKTSWAIIPNIDTLVKPISTMQ